MGKLLFIALAFHYIRKASANIAFLPVFLFLYRRKCDKQLVN